MKQWMSEDQGWVDRGPSRRPRIAKAGPVNGTVKAYSPTKLRAILGAAPRTLTPDEQAIALRNQIVADADLAAMEKWYTDGATVPEGDR